MIFKHIVDGVNLSKGKTYEQVPDEDLWEDGEIREGHSLAIKIYERVIMEGDWILVREHTGREVSDDNEHSDS